MKKSHIALGLLLTSISAVSTAQAFLPAEINHQNIQQLNSFNDPDALNWYQTSIASCEDSACKGRVSFAFYEVIFQTNQFSQVSTYNNFTDWMNTVKDNPSRENVLLSQKWSQAFSGLMVCLKDQKCSDWIVRKNYATQEQVDKAKQEI
ncbi:hypothetical protein [Aliivibrio salmonicida]|uniref:hypothetical protein n=1 Tax=Aliivibrio salmonicida TaxID=40269 RepID=UPI003D0E754E